MKLFLLASILTSVGCQANLRGQEATQRTTSIADKDKISRRTLTSDAAYLACGNPLSTGCRNNEGSNQILAYTTEQHEVRCCSDTSKSGWRNNDGCAVWSASNLFDAGSTTKSCHHASRYDQAEAICEANQGRLCTKTEILDGCTQGSGCSHDTDLVWSSSQPEGDVVETQWTACGRRGKCTDDEGDLLAGQLLDKTKDKAYVRCCSNSPIDGWKQNKKCVVYTESDAGFQCSGLVTFPEAEAICLNENARLCTQEEVLDNCARGTGCGYDSKQIWTSSDGISELEYTWVSNEDHADQTLGMCEGECDEDSHCQYGLVCVQRDHEAIDGCAGTPGDYNDYCGRPKENQLVLVGNDEGIAPNSLGMCQGDCDSDGDCMAGLKCFKRDGYTVVPGCIGEGSSNSDYCFAEGVLAKVGNDDNDDHELQYCQGDCDGDEDCAYGLVCYQRSSGVTEVPGCTGTVDNSAGSTDYCTYPWMIDQLVLVDNDVDQPLSTLLGVCQGDCDEDSDCELGLICDQRFDDETVNGCGGDGADGYDYCIVPPDNWLVKVGNDGVPSFKFPLAQCEGECDSDDECQGDLVCRERNGYEVVPGCEGVGISGTNYCGPEPTPGATRIVAFGDVHGDVGAARDALILANIIDDQDNWIGGTANVVQCGDQTDRGTTERQVLDLFEDLIVKAQAAGGAFYPLIGNHEVMNVEQNFGDVSDEGWIEFANVYDPDTADSVVMSYPLSERGRVQAFRPGGLYAHKLSFHPVILTLEGSIFVHGGVLPAHLDHTYGDLTGIAAINAEISDWLRGDDVPEPDTSDIQDEDHPLWSRHYSDEPSGADCALLDEVLAATGMERMVVAHTIQWEDGIHSGCDGKIWKVDIGMSEYYDAWRDVAPTQILEIVDGIVSVIRGE